MKINENLFELHEDGNNSNVNDLRSLLRKFAKPLILLPLYLSTLLMIINTRIISIRISNEISLTKTHTSTTYGLIFDTNNDLFPVGPIAQLGEHCTCIAEVRIRVQFRPEFFRRFFR